MVLSRHSDLTREIIGCALKVHTRLGPGFLESLYQKALVHEPSKRDHRVDPGRRIAVLYDGVVVGDFVSDLLVDETILVENKAIASLSSAHEAQLINYLAATRIAVGLLLNFGAKRLQIRRRVWD
jgi:GxxExxY protein